ncbi:MAG: CHAT domain-containing tetratricopeptide repeat protein [Elainellaceae cyanobacterium]
MNAKSLLPLLTALLIAPAAVPLLPTAPVRAQTAAETDAAALLEEAARLIQQGNQQFSVSQLQEALQSYQEALKIYRDPRVQAFFPEASRRGEGNVLGSLGVPYANLGQYQVAIDFFEQSLAIAREINDRLGEENALNNLGIAYQVLGQYQESIDFIEQSLIIARENDNRLGEGNALTNLGSTYMSLGRYQESIELFRQALRITQRIENRFGEGSVLGNLGHVYSALGEYQQALNYYQQQLEITQDIGDRAGELRALGGLANIYNDMGQYQQAIDLYQQALEIIQDIGDRTSEGALLGYLGQTYHNLGQYQEAINLYQQQLEVAQNVGDRFSEGLALGSLGQTYDALGGYQQSIDFYQQALEIAQSLGEPASEGGYLGGLGTAYFRLEQYQQARDFYQQSLEIMQNIGSRGDESVALMNLGIVYDALEQYQQAIDFYQQSLEITREMGDRDGEGEVLGNLGYTFGALEEHQQAINFYQQALEISRELNDRHSEGIALNNLGIAYLSLERYPQATETLFAAIEVLESLRDGDIPDAQRITFFDTQSSSYRVLQRSLIAQGETEQALAISERGRARAFVSSLAERQNLDAPALPPPSIADIQRTAQAQNATLVQYFRASFENGVSQLYIWVIQPTGEITFRSVDLSGLDTSLSDFITTGRDAIGLRSRNNDATIEVALTPEALRTRADRQRQILQELHTLLIDPIADLLPTDPDAPVIIIPHQELFLVPFAALVDANGDYLIQHHTLLTAPSIQVLQLLGEQQTTTAAGDPLIIGNPIMPSIWNPATGEEETLSSLPGAEAEAVAIAEVFNTEPLLWEQASEAAVTRRMATAPILHFATHGLLDYGDPTATCVRDFPGAIALAAGEGNDGLLTSAEIFDLTLSAELVVLSACDTGRGRITGDGVIGLSRAFIQAGVPQVLVSLWAVPDAPTAELMTTFYQQRDLTDTDAQALRQAMLITLQTHPNPRDWAAFTLIGGAQ